jgi:hypothetical protein
MARSITTKQKGDAGEMLIAAELTLNDIPALPVPDNWPHYDPPDDWPGYKECPPGQPQRISVKTRTYARSGNFVGYNEEDLFDWLAIVILPGDGFPGRRLFVVPAGIARRRSYVAAYRSGRGFFVHRLVLTPPAPLPEGEVPTGGWGLADYENNFPLSFQPSA